MPASWSQLATDIVISKYFRKAGLHGDKDKGETTVRQIVHRLAHTIRRAADDFGAYFATKADADAFEARFNMPLVHETVRAELNARRQGTHSTKTRGEVSGGGASVFR